MNQDVVRTMDVSDQAIQRVIKEEREELEEREEIYRGARPGIDPEQKTAILVDDGLATGATMRAAVDALRERNAEKIVVAVPTAPPETCAEFEDRVDETICLITPQPFFGVGGIYQDFSQTTNEEVRNLLEKAQERQTA
jgi:predicted phosphoribosyltransferase